jgi:hypothetical protein
MSWVEFEKTTPGMFRALCKRRNIRLKYERYANAETAAAVYNCARVSEEQPVLTAFDFVREPEAAAEHDRIREVKKVIMQAFSDLPAMDRSKLLELRAKLIAKLKAKGQDDAEQLFDECWPSLKPKEDEI